MPSVQKIGVLINRQSKYNRRHKPPIAQLSRILGEQGCIYETTSLSDARSALEALHQKNTYYWITDGGDGTLHCLINEAYDLFGADIFSKVKLSPTNGGTINFVARKLGIKQHTLQICEHLTKQLDRGKKPAIVELDTLKLEGMQKNSDGSEQPFHKIGFSTSIAGAGQSFFELYYGVPSPGPAAIVSIVGKALTAFAVNTLHTQLFHKEQPTAQAYLNTLFTHVPAKLSIDNKPPVTLDYSAIYAGSLNANLAGIFRLFPLAKETGKIHFITGTPSELDTVKALPSLIRGKPLNKNHVNEWAGTSLKVEATGDRLFHPIIDGECYTNLHSFTVSPGPKVRFFTVS